MNKIISYLALGLAILALAIGVAQKKPISFGTNANCNGQAGCTSFNDILGGSITVATAPSVNSKIALIGEASTTVNQFTLGGISTATSSATSTFTMAVPGITTSAVCAAGITTGPVTGFGVDAVITTSTANVATGTITFWNGFTTNPLTIATGTARVECHMLGS